MRRFPGLFAALMLLVLAAPAGAVGQFEIHLNPGPNLAANPAALSAFDRAAAEWEAMISSPIRININADLESVANPFVIGSTTLGPGAVNLDYATVRNAMAARNRPGDAVLGALPTSAQVSANVPATGVFDKTTLGVTTANQKALGLIANALTDVGIDGQIVFNSNFSFDYDRSDGIDSDKIDFETAATHEIGHVLGFFSDTDDYDFDPTLTDNATTLDLFRFNAAHMPTNLSEFTTFARELRPGQHASFGDLANQYPMSTGAANGDGNQASHWQDDFLFDPTTGTLTIGPTIGIMDPTLPFGATELISPADLRVMELIGYDTVPEPSSIAIIALVGLQVIARRSRTRSDQDRPGTSVPA